MDVLLVLLSVIVVPGSVSGLIPGGTNVCTISCPTTIYYAERYTVKCGNWLRRKRCTRYRQRSRPGTKTCYKCCSGWSSPDGNHCSIAICFGVVGNPGCYNSGSCVRPNYCTCPRGFYSPHCNRCTNIPNCKVVKCTDARNQQCLECNNVYNNQVKAYDLRQNTCKKLCSWMDDSTFCFPGTCTDGLAERCQCASGFSGKNCLSLNHSPTIRIFDVEVKTNDSHPAWYKFSKQSFQYSNIGPSNIQVKVNLHSAFAVNDLARYASGRRYINTYKLGVVYANVKVELRKGTQLTVVQNYKCSGISKDSPEANSQCFTPWIHISSSMQDGDRLEFSASVKNGGYVIINKFTSGTRSTPVKKYFSSKANTEMRRKVYFDYHSPVHCSQTQPKCSSEPLTLSSEYTKQPNISLHWSGWTDTGSGIESYEYHLTKASQTGGTLTFLTGPVTKVAPLTANSANILLNDTGVYSVMLEVFDKSGNHRNARRFVLFDKGSAVEIVPATKMVISGSFQNGGKIWHTKLNEQVKLVWTNHFRNPVHVNQGLLLAIRDHHSLVEPAYDRVTGQPPQYRSKEAVTNSNGITSFQIASDSGRPTKAWIQNWTTVASIRAQQHVFTFSQSDGDAAKIWVKALDVLGGYMIDSILLHFDSSPPVVQDVWLTRDGVNRLAVHHSQDLFQMILEFEAFDDHSGLHKITWLLYDEQNTSSILSSGRVAVRRPTTAHPSCPPPDCSCTAARDCFFRQYSISPNSSTPSGKHEYDYVFEIKVTNMAGLSTTKKYQITIDLSRPQPGVVYDSIVGQPDIDFQRGLQLHAAWSGFFDRESGIQIYQYIFGTSCKTGKDFGFGSRKSISNTTDTFASWTAPGNGKFFCTVVAYNNALEPSEPVCSDGVAIDNTPPDVFEVDIDHIHSAEGLLRDQQGTVWLMDSRRWLKIVKNLTNNCRQKVHQMKDVHLYPKYRLQNGSIETTDIFEKQCSLIKAAGSKIYLNEERQLRFSWRGEDRESRVEEYLVGLSTVPSADIFDLVDLVSTKTNSRHTFFHPDLDDGDEVFITIEAINGAGLKTRKVIGPIIVSVVPPVFQGTFHVSSKILSDGRRYLLAAWNKTQFVENTPDVRNFTYYVAIGHTSGGQQVLSYSPAGLYHYSQCPSPSQCVAIDTTKLDWMLHGDHTYYVSIKAMNSAGLSAVGTSQPYHHKVGKPARGVVMEVSSAGLKHQYPEDMDYQTTADQLRVSWWGFVTRDQEVFYNISVGTAPGAQDVVQPVTLTTAHLTYLFRNLNLQGYEKYYVTVKAFNELGNVIVSSDGVTVLPAHVQGNITITDGHPCRSENGKKNEYCPDKDFQSSTSVLVGHWQLNHTLVPYIRNVTVIVEEENQKSGAWLEVTAPIALPWTDNVILNDLTLDHGGHYHLRVKFCHSDGCFLDSASNGVWVIAKRPEAGVVTDVRYSEPEQSLNITWEQFKDPLLPTNIDFMDHYEWNVAEQISGQSLHYIFKWQRFVRIGKMGSQFTSSVNLGNSLHFTRCLLVVIKGFNKLNQSSVGSREIKSCDSLQVKKHSILDVVGKLSPSTDADNPDDVYLDGKPVRSFHDKEYSPMSTRLSAVWPDLLYSEYRWKVITTSSSVTWGGIKPQTSLDFGTYSCLQPESLTCGNTTERFVNVDKLSLVHGRRYYVCISAEATNVTSKGVHVALPDLSVCSDGITVDLTPPRGRSVRILSRVDKYQISKTELTVSWQPFVDVEEENVRSLGSAIARYQVAVGSTPSGREIEDFVDAEHATSVHFTNLQLHNKQRYYATVKATDYAGWTTTVSSEPVIVDASPPEITATPVNVGNHYIATMTIFASWDGVFSDRESGIERYQWCVGSKPLTCDIKSLMDSLESSGKVALNKKWQHDGHVFYVSVKAFDRVGLSSLTSSWGLTLDLSPPVPGEVFDGSQTNDVDYQAADDFIYASWKGFHDPHSPIVDYRVSIGTCKGCGDLIELLNVGLQTAINITVMPLEQGLVHYVQVEACNAADLCSQATSDGFIVDSSPPFGGIVQDGIHGGDLEFQQSRTYLAAHWFGFSDMHSDISHYVWWAGTSPGAEDIVSPREVYLRESAFGSAVNLPVGVKIYSTVRAYSKAGLYNEKTSNGFTVIAALPNVTTLHVHQCPNQNSECFQASGTVLGVKWSIQDSSEDVLEQHLTLFSSQLTSVKLPSVKIYGELLQNYTFTNLSLSDGVVYYIRLSVCNRALLCRDLETDHGVLTDNSVPSPGAFAASTKHAAMLNRHQANGITYNQSAAPMINLAWLGFHDPHSGIKKYYIGVGTQYDSSDLLKVSEFEVSHQMGPAHQDEGPIQTAVVPLKQPLQPQQTVFISITAENKAGLKSRTLQGSFYVASSSVDSGRLDLIRRCQPVSCAGHCTCAPEGGRCQKTTCNNVTGSAQYRQYVVSDVIDIRSIIDSSKDASFTSSRDILAAVWNPVSSNGILATRFEWTAGASGHPPGSGIYELHKEQPWQDVGLHHEALLALGTRAFLKPQQKYVFYVRAWYSTNHYTIFQSNGIIVDFSSPAQSSSFRVMEAAESGSHTDVDFLRTTTAVNVSWRNVFSDSLTPLKGYSIALGSYLGGSDVFKAARMNKTTWSYIRNLHLLQGTDYYSTVGSCNLIGLCSLQVSDGFKVDLNPPDKGFVWDGNTRDVDFQSTDDLVSASWHGFTDNGSFIDHYLWCVGSSPGADNIIKCEDVGLETTASAPLPVTLTSGTMYYSTVYAVDAANWKSAGVSSDGVLIDKTPPLSSSDLIMSPNILQNPLFVVKMNKIAPWFVNGHYTVNYSSTLPSGENYISLSGSINQTISTNSGSRYQINFLASNGLSSFPYHGAQMGTVSAAGMRQMFQLADWVRSCNSSTCPPQLMWHTYVYFFIANGPQTTITISSLGKYGAIALSNVKVQEFQVSRTKTLNSSVELNIITEMGQPSISASWDIVDPESGMKEFLWAIGTKKGGVQLQNFQSVGQSRHAVARRLTIDQGSSVHVTVVAENKAGLSTVLYSNAVTYDNTAPTVCCVKEGQRDDADFISTEMVSVYWKVHDDESEIDSCMIGVGTSPRETDALPFKNVGPVVTATLNMTGKAREGQMVFVTVECWNVYGLSSRAVSDGITFTFNAPDVSTAQLRVVQHSGTQYRLFPGYQAEDSQLRLLVNSLKFPQEYTTRVTVSSSGKILNQFFNSSLSSLYQDSLLLSTLSLTSGQHYKVGLEVVNPLGQASRQLTSDFYVVTSPPAATGNSLTPTWLDSTTLKLDFPTVFVTKDVWYYEVSVGTQPRKVDVMKWQESTVPYSTVNNVARGRNYYVILTAVNKNGLYNTVMFKI